MILLTYQEILAFYDEKKRVLFYQEFADRYRLKMNYDGIIIECELKKGTPECIDFEEKYKSNCNKPIKP